jgi:hypothetical protein
LFSPSKWDFCPLLAAIRSVNGGFIESGGDIITVVKKHYDSGKLVPYLAGMLKHYQTWREVFHDKKV